jgi:hypothetical protein
MRGLRVFCTWVNQTGIRPDQTVDTYVGEPGHGHVKHYLLDFGEAFGGHALTHDVVYMWDGYETYVDFGSVVENLVTLGMKVHPWEDLELSPYAGVGLFEAEIFEPENWREVYPYPPIRDSRPEDDYWAAKIVGAVTRAHLSVLFEDAGYSEPAAADYLIDTLMKRRQKVLEYFLYRVSPLELEALEDSELLVRDVGRELCDRKDTEGVYEIHFYDDEGRVVAPERVLRTASHILRIPVDAAWTEASGYLRVEAYVRTESGRTPRPAQFHLRESDGEIRLVGVVH